MNTNTPYTDKTREKWLAQKIREWELKDPANRIKKIKAAVKGVVKFKVRAGRPKALPPMTLDQRKMYTKLRNNGVPREAAIEEALKP
jgi:hypothetical protein